MFNWPIDHLIGALAMLTFFTVNALMIAWERWLHNNKLKEMEG